MKIDIAKIKKLLNSDISGYKIYKNTGISQSTISDYRNEKKIIENMTIETGLKLMKFIEEEEQINY